MTPQADNFNIIVFIYLFNFFDSVVPETFQAYKAIFN